MIAFHSIFSMYGFWLPNDPRGSGSDYIAVWELFRYGPATKVHTRTSVAHVAHDARRREAAKQALKHPPVKVNLRQAAAIVEGFGKACADAGYRIHACAVLQEHAHLVIGWHVRDARVIVGHLRSAATRKLKELGLWYDDDRPIWGEHGWNVYLDTPTDVRRAIGYVEANPEKERLEPQHWDIVTPLEPATIVSRPAPTSRRRLGGAALRSQEEARRKRRG